MILKPEFQQKSFCITIFFLLVFSTAYSQITPKALSINRKNWCGTMIAIDQAVRKNPGIIDKWKKKGEEEYQKFLQRKAAMRGALGPDTLVIPIVFHLVDDAEHLAWVTDREIYDQVEILNQAYNGEKVLGFQNVIPSGIFSRKGSIPIRFVLARRAPDGTLTSGIERRVNTTPDRVSIKSTAAGGLDAWDTDKYLNVWVGTFSGGDDGLLGVGTFPFIDTEGPQGVVIGIATIPYTSNVSRSYYPSYSEGGTLVHELGHFFYLFHTFGDSYVCNNNDFRIQSGWPLPAGDGPEGDDTPEEKADSTGNADFGNPSMNYSDGCTTFSGGEMYGSFMNYFDDRALFMFSNGQTNRVAGCIQYYRTDLPNSIGAVPPASVTDAYVVSVSPYGSPERRTFAMNNVPLIVKIRNYGSTTLNNVMVTALIDGAVKLQQIVTLNLLPGNDSDVSLGNINAVAGSHMITVYTSNPNGVADAFTNNDTLQSFVGILGGSINAPFTEKFSNSSFPPAGWMIWNPNNNETWSYNSTSGYSTAGSVTMQNFSANNIGQLDDMVMPPVNIGTADSSVLSFRYAYAVYDEKDVSVWDGLEIYLSNDGGATYKMIYKKTGDFLRSVLGNMTTSFSAPPSSPGSWGFENINLTPYINPGKNFLIKFRGLNAFGNNLYLDDISVSAFVSFHRDVQMTSIANIPQYICGSMPVPSVTFRSNGKDPLTSLKINYQIAGQALNTQQWNGTLTQNNSITLNLPALQNQAPGAYQLIVYTSDPNGLPDEAPQNDTMKMMFYVMGHATNPVTEGFDGSTFPPDQWVLQQNGNGHSWQRTTAASTTGSASSEVNNFNFDMLGNPDNLISPIIGGNAGFDSLFVSFDYAYAPGSDYPGFPGSLEDSLQVNVSTDCGQTMVNIFNQFGNQLITATNPTAWKNTSFVPGQGDWKNVSVYLTPLIGSSDFQVFFTSKGNNRNNLYLDNVKVYGIIVPELLKKQGYLFYPSPFRNQFIIRNFEQPTGLQNVQIYNNLGQLIWQQGYTGNAQKMIFVNAAGWPSGVYIVKMNFTDKHIVDRVVKQ